MAGLAETIGIELADATFMPLLTAPAELPARFEGDFSIAEPNQPGVTLILRGRAEGLPPRHLGTVHLEGLPPSLPGRALIRVRLMVDCAGHTRLFATYLGTMKGVVRDLLRAQVVKD